MLCLNYLSELRCNYHAFSATMTKIIKEMLPPDVRVARDTQDLLIECCVGEFFIMYCYYYVDLFHVYVNYPTLSYLFF